MKNYRPLLVVAAISLIISACVLENPSGNTTPTADLYFTVIDDNGTPLPNAQIYLFSFESSYLSYISSNPNGDPDITPSLGSDDVGITTASGTATFFDRTLDGNAYQSGEIWYNRPNPIYYRVQAQVDNGGTIEYLTNDGGDFKLTFPELESGERVVETLEIVVR
ncbi:MAG: hypothetical protein OHK0039_21920 [Bacteroidia bacterium]